MDSKIDSLIIGIGKSLREALHLLEGLIFEFPGETKIEPCKHLHSEVRGSNRIGHAFCQDCGEDVMLTDVFNNWIEEFKKLRDQLK